MRRKNGIRNKNNLVCQLDPPSKISEAQNELSNELANNVRLTNRNEMIMSKISNLNALTKINRARAHDKNPNLLPTSTSSNSALSKTSALNKLICARHHDTSTKSALSTMILPVPVPATKSILPLQN